MSLKIRKYAGEDATAWDQFVRSSCNGTFLHTRLFLSYHGSKFEDASYLVENDRGQLIAVFPAAIEPTAEKTVTSHPGITFGGIVHDGSLRGEAMLQALTTICLQYKDLGFLNLKYKSIPYTYHQLPANDDSYGLFRLGAHRYRTDLSATIDNRYPLKLTKGRRWALKKAQKAGVTIATGGQYLAAFWRILEANLAQKYKARPIHSLEEVTLLASWFPANIECVVAFWNGKVVAGTLLFKGQTVNHTQYIATDACGQENCALDVVIAHCINASLAEGKTYFDFGTSNEDSGRVLNEGLYQFKLSFGAGAVTHDSYSISLADIERDAV